MTDLEIIEDQYPELHFWGIEVPNSHFHGAIVGNDVYINLLQPDLDWLRTALHECIHHEYDSNDLSELKSFKALHAEGWAMNESKREYNRITSKTE